jgi:hypothetical protein
MASMLQFGDKIQTGSAVAVRHNRIQTKVIKILLCNYILSGNVFRPLRGHLQAVELQKYYTSQEVINVYLPESLLTFVILLQFHGLKMTP